MLGALEQHPPVHRLLLGSLGALLGFFLASLGLGLGGGRSGLLFFDLGEGSAQTRIVAGVRRTQRPKPSGRG